MPIGLRRTVMIVALTTLTACSGSSSGGTTPATTPTAATTAAPSAAVDGQARIACARAKDTYNQHPQQPNLFSTTNPDGDVEGQAQRLISWWEAQTAMYNSADTELQQMVAGWNHVAGGATATPPSAVDEQHLTELRDWCAAHGLG